VSLYVGILSYNGAVESFRSRSFRFVGAARSSDYPSPDVECPGVGSFLFMVFFEPLLETVVQNMKWR
jgi:hypothetical protein